MRVCLHPHRLQLGGVSPVQELHTALGPEPSQSLASGPEGWTGFPNLQASSGIYGNGGMCVKAAATPLAALPVVTVAVAAEVTAASVVMAIAVVAAVTAAAVVVTSLQYHRQFRAQIGCSDSSALALALGDLLWRGFCAMPQFRSSSIGCTAAAVLHMAQPPVLWESGKRGRGLPHSLK